MVDVVDNLPPDLSPFISKSSAVTTAGMYYRSQNKVLLVRKLKLSVNFNDDVNGLYLSEDEGLLCENVTLSLDYKFYWKGNGITGITVTRTVGTIVSNSSGK